ncbi:MAG: hypothetical protein AAFN48_01860 [Pseudomonadota bacterium]
MIFRHALIAVLVSFGLSIFFWAAFGVFLAVPFLVVSTLCALGGGVVGWVAGKRLWVTAIMTALIRSAVFIAVLGPT